MGVVILPDGTTETLSESELALLRRWLAGRRDRGRTHWAGCELEHIACAVRRLADAQAALAQWEATGDAIMTCVTGRPGPLSDADVCGAVNELRAAGRDIGVLLRQLPRESFGFMSEGWRTLRAAEKLAQALAQEERHE